MCGGCWLLLGCLFPVCQTNRLVCLLLPPTLMLPLIVLICPWTQRLEELSCTSELLWPSLCTCSVGLQSPEPNRHGVARPVGAWQPDNGVMSFFFPFNSPTEDDVYVIDFSPTSLSNMFPLQCAKQDWVQAWSMHCFSFSITLEWAEDTKGYTGEVWQGMEAKQRFWRPPQGRCMSLPGMFVCACVHVCGGKKGVKERLTCREKLNRFMFF